MTVGLAGLGQTLIPAGVAPNSGPTVFFMGLQTKTSAPIPATTHEKWKLELNHVHFDGDGAGCSFILWIQ